MKIRLLTLGLAILLALSTTNFVFARDTEPSSVENRRDEYLLKQRLKPVLMEVLKEEYLGLAVNIKYVLLHDPIVSQKSKISQLKLPGFGTRITITNDPNDIAGYIDKYIRYSTLTIITRTKQPEAIEMSIAKLIKENENIDIGGRDTLSFLVIDEELKKEQPGIEIVDQEEKKREDSKEKQKEKVDELVKKLDEDRKEKKDRLARLFPELEQPTGPIDPRQEAESSKHLISSKKAYYNNDLNTALNEVIEAININPYASKSYEMLGSIYYRLKWYNLALNNWEKALALDPDNTKLGRYIEKAKREL
ncbi:tetratricopeptide repeat protein [bacterium]|nr:tetratricopeptide repeat protein [bacterium]